jgi:hypothetical protein
MPPHTPPPPFCVLPAAHRGKALEIQFFLIANGTDGNHEFLTLITKAPAIHRTHPRPLPLNIPPTQLDQIGTAFATHLRKLVNLFERAETIPDQTELAALINLL